MTVVLAGDPAIVERLGAAGLSLGTPQRRSPEGAPR